MCCCVQMVCSFMWKIKRYNPSCVIVADTEPQVTFVAQLLLLTGLISLIFQSLRASGGGVGVLGGRFLSCAVYPLVLVSAYHHVLIVPYMSMGRFFIVFWFASTLTDSLRLSMAH